MSLGFVDGDTPGRRRTKRLRPRVSQKAQRTASDAYGTAKPPCGSPAAHIARSVAAQIPQVLSRVRGRPVGTARKQPARRRQFAASLWALPALKYAEFDAPMAIRSPVRGFRPSRAGRSDRVPSHKSSSILTAATARIPFASGKVSSPA